MLLAHSGQVSSVFNEARLFRVLPELLETSSRQAANTNIIMAPEPRDCHHALASA